MTPTVIGCPKCGHIRLANEPCEVCYTKQSHKRYCRYRKAVECPVGIECEHGYDVCPICDPCTCNGVSAAVGGAGGAA